MNQSKRILENNKLTLLVCLIVFIASTLSISCTNKYEDAVVLTVDFEWNPPCTPLDNSPKIIIDQIPEGTVRWYVEMTDLDLPAFDHGSGFTPVSEKPVIPAGAVVGTIKGPSPPYGSVHEYEITVMARDAENRTIGIGKKVLAYPPPGEEEIRWLPCEKGKSG
jgi:phosphatidylethanolamine-binding protein (PEBP) family uncharacterized protein